MLHLAKKIVYTDAVPLATITTIIITIIIINLYFSKENSCDKCVVIKTSGVH